MLPDSGLRALAAAGAISAAAGVAHDQIQPASLELRLGDVAFETVRRLPPADQDDIARAMLRLAKVGGEAPEPIDPAHLPDVREGLAQARRREFASEAAVEAAFHRFGH